MSKALTQALRQAIIAVAILGAFACQKEKQYTWKDVLPTSGCDPQTPEARAKLGTCPKVADPQHPTQQEVQEFVVYMNKKDTIEGHYDSRRTCAPRLLGVASRSRHGSPRFETNGQEGGL